MAVTVNAAVYGQGVYGVARYGKVIVSNLDQAVGTGQVFPVQVNLAKTLASVSATGQVNTVNFTASSSIVLNSVTATGSIGTLKANITENLGSVSSTGLVNQVQVNVAKILGSVEGTGSIGTLSFSNTLTLLGVQGQTEFGQLKVNTTEFLDSVSATGQVNAVDVTASSNIVIASVSATGFVQPTTQTGVVFNFEAVKEIYSRQRTIYLSRVA
jgi:hypothetical protein